MKLSQNLDRQGEAFRELISSFMAENGQLRVDGGNPCILRGTTNKVLRLSTPTLAAEVAEYAAEVWPEVEEGRGHPKGRTLVEVFAETP